MELDKLFYTLGLNDISDKNIKEIQAHLDKIEFKAKVSFDAEHLKKSFSAALSSVSAELKKSAVDATKGIDTKSIASLRDEIQKKLGEVSFNPSFEGAKTGLNELIILAQRLEDHLTRIPAAMEAVRQATENARKEYERLESSLKSAGGGTAKQSASEMDRLQKKITEVDRMLAGINEKRARGFIAGKDVEEAVRKLETLRATLSSLQSSGDVSAFKRMTSLGVVQDQIREARQLLSLGQKQVAQEVQIAREKDKAADAERKKADAMRGTLSISQKLEQSFMSQSGALGQLGMQIGNVFSVYTIERFLQKVIETGGELEKQRLAMSSMLGSDYLSGRLMDQIQSLAVKSPFGVMQLNSYAKQLVAFGVETDQLYESLRRLADISAGVGVDMQRVAYAFGQVKSRTWLDAKELRQFAYAGIPLLEELSKYYTEAERAKGSDKTVSTRDVRTMIQNRGVSFEDMRDVLWQMTDEGGRFYNMQEVMSESLSAKYKNLGDAYDIMVSEIAQSSNSVLKAPAELLTLLTQNWEKLVPIIGTATAALIASKAVWMAQIGVMNLHGNALLRQIAHTEGLSLAQRLYITSSKQMTASDLAELRATGALNGSQIARIAVLKKMTAAEVESAIAMGTFTREEYAAALAGTRFTWSLKGVASAFKAFFASMGPIGWISLAVGAVWELVSAWKSSSDSEKEALGNLRKYATESSDTVSSVASGVREANSKGLSETRAKEEYDKAMESLSAYYGKDGVGFIEQGLVDAEGKALESYTEKLRALEKELAKLEEYGKDTGGTASAITGVFDGLDSSDIEEWMEEVAHMRREVDAFVNDYPEKAREALEAINEELKLGIAKGAPFGEYIEKIFSDDRITVNAKRLFEKLAPGQIINKDLIFGEGMLMDFEQYNRYFHDLKEGIEREYRKVFKDDSFSIFNATSEQRAKIVADIKAKVDTSDMSDGVKEAFLNGMYREFHWTVFIDKKESEGFNLSDIESSLQSIKANNEAIEKLTKARDKASNDKASGYNKTINRLTRENADSRKTLSDTYGLGSDYVDSYLNAGKSRGGKSGGGGGESRAEKEMRQYFQNLQKEINLIEKYYQRYKSLADKIGRERAAAILNGNPIFKDIVAGGKAVTDYGSFNSILQGEKAAVEAGLRKYGKVKGGREQADNLLSSLNEKILGNDTDSISRAIDLAGKTMKAYVEEIGKQYDIYRKVFESTGDRSLASIMAFGTPDAIREGAERYRDALFEELRKLLPGADAGMLRGFYGMEPEDIASSVVKGDGEDDKSYAARLKNIAYLTEEFRKADEKDAKERVERYLKAVDDTMTYYERMEQEVREGERKIQAARDLAGEEEAAKIRRRMEADRLFEQVAGSPAAKSFAASYLSMSKEAVSAYANRLRNDLVKAFSAGTKSAEEFRKELEAINRIEQESNRRKSDFKSFSEGGLNGLFENLKSEAASAVANASATVDETKAMRDRGLATDNDVKQAEANLKEQTDKQKALNGELDGFSDGLNMASTAFQVLTGVLDGFKQVFEQFATFFESIGDREAADTAGNIADGIGAVTKIFEPASDLIQNAMSGNIGGLVSSVISAPVKTVLAPWEAFNKLHDKKKQQQIDRSKEKVMQLEGAYRRLNRTIERQLGATTGAQAKQQIDNLRQQREEVLRQQQLEEDKKNSEASAIEDYRNQIAELDDQIAYFYEDLYSEEFSANVKDMAKDLSNAIVDAWANGENAAEAYDETVSGILRNLASNALRSSIMEPALDKVREMLQSDFLTDGLSDAEFMRLADELMQVKGVEAEYEKRLDELDAQFFAKYGTHLYDSERGGLTGSIEGVTEETADLLASYLNAARSDISVIRGYIQQYFESGGESAVNAVQLQQLQQLQMIAGSAERNAIAAEQIQAILDSVTSGTKQISVA